ncbi:hypothetical protein C1646_677637 [Rhizophagus diaphanus]|nr:hypothetical protein C1646_677637 [Rhizophagus diaphanus] [Rhizophagus sp. MUCL 43196]
MELTIAETSQLQQLRAEILGELNKDENNLYSEEEEENINEDKNLNNKKNFSKFRKIKKNGIRSFKSARNLNWKRLLTFSFFYFIGSYSVFNFGKMASVRFLEYESDHRISFINKTFNIF